MKRTRKQYEEFLNEMSPDCESELWIIGGKNRYARRNNWGAMMKRYDPVGFQAGFIEWSINEDSIENKSKTNKNIV